MDRVLGIIGGMGPLATVKMIEKIVMHTDAKCDQDHLHIVVDINTSIPDRTSYLIGSGEDPRRELIHSAKLLCTMGADYLIMPCNTAHYFYNDIVKEINVPFLHMIEETAKNIKNSNPEIAKAGLLATEGTCETGVYDDVFREYGIQLIKPSVQKQKAVSDVIYGIKENQKNYFESFMSAVEELKAMGCDAFVLGCTELSVLYTQYKPKGNFVDPMEIIALSAIRFGGRKCIGD